MERARRLPRGTRIEVREGVQVIVLPGPKEDHVRTTIPRPIRKTVPMIGIREPVGPIPKTTSPTEVSLLTLTTDKSQELQ